MASQTDECLKIVQDFKIGRMIGASEFAAIKALLESIEHYREVIAAMACQPESIEQERHALPHIDEAALRQQLCNLTVRLLGPSIQDLQMREAIGMTNACRLGEPPKA